MSSLITPLYHGIFWKEEETGNHQSRYNTMILRYKIDSDKISELVTKTINNVHTMYIFPT